jgi:hypothetical protein
VEAEVEPRVNLTDFLGKEYGPGDLVVYAAMSGRCVNIVVARVVDIWRVWHNSYYVGDRYGWERLADDDPVPHHYRYDGADLGECDSATRVKLQPIRGARWNQHDSGRAVTLTVTENIVKWEGELPDAVPDEVP